MALAAAATCLGALLLGPAPGLAGPATPENGNSLEASLKPSSLQQTALSDHLRRVGALFYGAWWCPACMKQKSLFGREAVATLPYVECDKTDEGRERCQAAEVRVYPTWVLGSSRLEGVQSLEELKAWSRYPSQP